MIGRTLTITALSCAALAAPAGATSVLVGFEDDVQPAGQERIIADSGGRLAQRFGAVRGGRLAVVAPRNKLAAEVLAQRLARRPGVAYAEPDYGVTMTATKTPDDPFYPQQYALGSSGHDIDAPEAWGMRTNCAKVAVLDSGADLDHPDLEPNIITGEDKPKNGKDDDKNGYVDDVRGWDVTDGKGSAADDNGHGTHVAGIIAGRGNNATGVSGVCWSAKLVPVKVLDEDGRGSVSDVIAGIEYAVKAGAKVLNVSLATHKDSDALHDAVKWAADKDALIVVAAGNDGADVDADPVFPAAYNDDNLLVIAATDRNDELASFSNYGQFDVDMAAPGVDIRSTWLDGGYRTVSGTSMAAPYVSAVAGMMRKEYSDIPYDSLRRLIRAKGDEQPSLRGKVVKEDRLNARRALESVAHDH